MEKQELIKAAALEMAIDYVKSHSPRYIFPLQEKGNDAGLKIAIFTREQVLNALESGKFENACKFENGVVKISRFQRDRMQRAFGKPIFEIKTSYSKYDDMEKSGVLRSRTFEKVCADLMKITFNASVQWIGGLNHSKVDIIVNGVNYEVKGDRGMFAQQ